MLPEYIASTGRKGYSDHAKIRAFVVMKCECFSCVTDLLDYLQNNLLIAHYCGFNIMKPLPSYWTLERFIKKHKNELLQLVMQTQVKKLFDLGVLDTSFIALDSTPVSANTSQNNPKSFKKDKFNPRISLLRIKTANLVFTPPLISMMKRIMSSTGVTKIISSLTVSLDCRFMR